jgi:valyl-tRNA synthetase
MPFLTEELWQRLVEKAESTPASICLAPFPQANPAHENEPAASGFALLQEIVVDQRALRADNKIDPKLRVEARIRPLSDRAAQLASAEIALLDHLTNNQNEIVSAELTEGAARSKNEYQTALKLSGSQAGAMRQRLVKEIEQLEKVIASSRKQLGSETFVSKAPPHIVESIRAKLADYEAQLDKSRAALTALEP